MAANIGHNGVFISANDNTECNWVHLSQPSSTRNHFQLKFDVFFLLSQFYIILHTQLNSLIIICQVERRA